MTGQFPARHGITDWIGASAGEDWRKANRFNKLLPAEYVRELHAAGNTPPEAMREGGYKTFLAGKWHLGSKGSWTEDTGYAYNLGRSEVRRVGKAWVSTCRYRGSPYPSN